MSSSGSWSPHRQPISGRLRAPWEEPSTASEADFEQRKHIAPCAYTPQICQKLVGRVVLCYEASFDGNVKRTIVPLSPLSRESAPLSCCAKISTSRPPAPESARRGSTPLPLSETVRQSIPDIRFSVTRTVPVVSTGNAYLTAFVTSSLTMSPSGSDPRTAERRASVVASEANEAAGLLRTASSREDT